MTFSELVSMARLKVAAAGKAGQSNAPISDDDLKIILNEGALDIARLTECLVKTATFNCEADKQEYDISTKMTDYLGMRKEGLWWYDSEEEEWKQLEATTIEYLNENKSGWKDEDADDPDYYYIAGNKLGLYPTPDTDYTDGFEAYYIYKPTAMSSDGDYPFGNLSEISWLAPFHKLIINYWEIEAREILGKEAGTARTKYYAGIREMRRELKLRPDLMEQLQDTGVRFKQIYGKF